NVVDAFSILEDNGKYYAFIVEDGKAKRIEVEVGIKTLSKYEVLNLPLGTKIIINPFKVTQGEKVKIKK
ncbi:MAG: hypothetical protein KAH04_01295, partial [Psychrilyobacter sp.]|nr:hypothetical protein [Psychrilyobacter sp.]